MFGFKSLFLFILVSSALTAGLACQSVSDGGAPASAESATFEMQLVRTLAVVSDGTLTIQDHVAAAESCGKRPIVIARIGPS